MELRVSFDYAWYNTSSSSIKIFLMALRENFTAIGKLTKRLFLIYSLYSYIRIIIQIKIRFHLANNLLKFDVVSHSFTRSSYIRYQIVKYVKKPRTFLFVLQERKWLSEVFNVVFVLIHTFKLLCFQSLWFQCSPLLE